jgi:NAD(P)-dependent dehydrogenase (short-subunit alcohol dehydrogenase family)
MTQPVLVTGSSSGIGLAMVELLAERGVPVFATVRSAADAERLAALEGVEPVLSDVRSDDDVARLRAAIDERGAGLWGLVNNAGVAQVGHLTGESLQDMRDVFDINVFGAHRVTNAVVDLLLESGGRIVNMSSISGTLSSAQMGIYSMSKHALEAYTDSLWAQLRDRGVHVCAVVPGNFQSSIATNIVKRVSERDGANEWLRSAYESGTDLSRRQYPPPDAVAEACYHALFDGAPHRRYLVTPDAQESLMTLRQAAMELLQLNRAASHPSTHEELHALLDEVTGLMHEQERQGDASAPDD